MTLRFDQLWNTGVCGSGAAVFAAQAKMFRPVDWMPDRSTCFRAGVAIGGDHRGPMLTLRRHDRSVGRARLT